jgi:Sec-independent protein translocase protein TatA
MEILGIGPLELIFILIIALIVLGPKDMVKAGKSIGRLLRTIVTSPNWRAIQQTSREIRTLPNRLIREAGLEELKNQMPQVDQLRKESGVDDLKQISKELSDWTTPPTIGKPAEKSADKPEDKSADLSSPPALEGGSQLPTQETEEPTQED